MVPLLFVASIQFILALSFTGRTLEEKLTIYDIDYQPSDFEITELNVDYISDDEMQVDFTIIGGDGIKDLTFEIYCQDLDHDKLVSNSEDPGSLTLSGVGSSSIQSHLINKYDNIGGTFTWVDVPSGDQIVRLSVQLESIFLDTWTFQIELRND